MSWTANVSVWDKQLGRVLHHEASLPTAQAACDWALAEHPGYCVLSVVPDRHCDECGEPLEDPEGYGGQCPGCRWDMNHDRNQDHEAIDSQL